MTDLLTLHRRTMATATAIVGQVRADQLGAPTPCAGWDLSQLLAHMIGQNHGFASAARGETFEPATWADRPVTEAPHEAFAASAAEVVAAFATAGAVDRDWPLLVGADGSVAVPGRQALGFHFIDYVAHAWDVAVSIGIRPEFEDDILAAVLPLAEEVPAEGPTRNGPYAPFAPVVVLEEAGQDDLSRLLAILGRDPDLTADDLQHRKLSTGEKVVVAASLPSVTRLRNAPYNRHHQPRNRKAPQGDGARCITPAGSYPQPETFCCRTTAECVSLETKSHLARRDGGETRGFANVAIPRPRAGSHARGPRTGRPPRGGTPAGGPAHQPGRPPISIRLRPSRRRGAGAPA
ncbi:TIGR03086 family metal-binding protein [Glycomyces sp. NPDC049804]|uniref:TIGR03086 family metal-binding protein n=1 Tax=Glycomyces sp. NPDC049804 TaxID=3154363 RepID=UPI00342BF90E